MVCCRGWGRPGSGRARRHIIFLQRVSPLRWARSSEIRPWLKRCVTSPMMALRHFVLAQSSRGLLRRSDRSASAGGDRSARRHRPQAPVRDVRPPRRKGLRPGRGPRHARVKRRPRPALKMRRHRRKAAGGLTRSSRQMISGITMHTRGRRSVADIAASSCAAWARHRRAVLPSCRRLLFWSGISWRRSRRAMGGSVLRRPISLRKPRRWRSPTATALSRTPASYRMHLLRC